MDDELRCSTRLSFTSAKIVISHKASHPWLSIFFWKEFKIWKTMHTTYKITYLPLVKGSRILAKVLVCTFQMLWLSIICFLPGHIHTHHHSHLVPRLLGTKTDLGHPRQDWVFWLLGHAVHNQSGHRPTAVHPHLHQSSHICIHGVKVSQADPGISRQASASGPDLLRRLLLSPCRSCRCRLSRRSSSAPPASRSGTNTGKSWRTGHRYLQCKE